MKRLRAILSNVLGIEEESINDETSPGSVDSWDSFNALLLVTALESQFNVKFTMDEVQAVRSVKDIKELLHRYGVTLQDE